MTVRNMKFLAKIAFWRYIWIC